jgi:hypothetical protein
MLKVASHCSFRPDLHELWSKEGPGVKLRIWFQPKIPWKQGSNEVWSKHVIHHWKDISKGYNIMFSHSQKKLFEKDMNIQTFGTTRVLILGHPLGSPKEKWHLDLIPMKKHKVYSREESGASFQRLQVVWRLCLRLSLLNLLHHFYSTCINCLFSWLWKLIWSWTSLLSSS